MKIDNSLKLLAEPRDIHNFVFSLWEEGPIKQSHRNRGLVHRIVDKYARRPQIFAEASDIHVEWTHFYPMMGVTLFCEYDNPHIRDLRYLHEIHHAATMPHIPNMNIPTLRNKIRNNEHGSSTMSEMAIYLECPELRPLTFQHGIFIDRFLFPDGDLNNPNEQLLERWKAEPEIVFQELMYARNAVVTAKSEDIDETDPVIIWLRRYPEQGRQWIKIWSDRYQAVDDAMIRIRDNMEVMSRKNALENHLEFLLSPAIAEGTNVPFYAEAKAFRASYDSLINAYDDAMEERGQKAVKHKTKNASTKPVTDISAAKPKPRPRP